MCNIFVALITMRMQVNVEQVFLQYWQGTTQSKMCIFIFNQYQYDYIFGAKSALFIPNNLIHEVTDAVANER